MSNPHRLQFWRFISGQLLTSRVREDAGTGSGSGCEIRSVIGQVIDRAPRTIHDAIFPRTWQSVRDSPEVSFRRRGTCD